jgi:glycosyltransferase involved in cell wall biosynthesis
VCLFSGFEGVPFSVQEAMWVGRPVVLSPLPALRWFAGDQARWAVDADEAAQALVALCDHEVAAAEGRAAGRRARSLLTPDAPFPRLRADYERRWRTPR